MSEENPQAIDLEVERVLIQQAQWATERLEGVNQGLMTRAASLMGFAGLELSLVGQLVVNLRRPDPGIKWSSCHTWLVFGLDAATVISLLTCIGFLFACLRGIKEPKLPGVEAMVDRLDWIDSRDFDKEKKRVERASFPLQQLLMRGEKTIPYGVFLTQENHDRGKKFIRGFKTLVLSQVILGALVLVSYWR